MTKTKPAPARRQEPLADGQVWNMDDLKLQVELVGKLLVHYKLGKPNAVRTPNSISSKSNLEKFLKKNKAVLARKVASAAVKK